MVTVQVLDAQVGTATRRLTVEEFSHLLDIVVEGIEYPGLEIGQSQRLIHLSTILLHDAPQGQYRLSGVISCSMMRTLQGH